MKIVFLNFYGGETYRGAETFVFELANRLVGLGHEVFVYQNGPKVKDSKYKTVTIGLKIKWDFRPGGIPFLNYWSLLIKNFTHRVLNKLANDIDIIFPVNGQWSSILCKLWTLGKKGKLVISGQSGVGFDDRVNLYTFPDVFVPITKDALIRSRQRNSHIKFEYIPNGVDLNIFKKEGKTYNTKLKRPIILTVGALIKQKRIDLIIKAVSKLENVNLLIVGDGSEKDNLELLANKLIPERYEFLRVKHDEMPNIYRSADVFALIPESSEAFGIVYVEAMASGLPVVALNDNQRKEIVGSGGILVEHQEPDDIAFAIKAALDRKWGNAPRAQAEKFSWDEIAKKYEDLFNHLFE